MRIGNTIVTVLGDDGVVGIWRDSKLDGKVDGGARLLLRADANLISITGSLGAEHLLVEVELVFSGHLLPLVADSRDCRAGHPHRMRQPWGSRPQSSSAAQAHPSGAEDGLDQRSVVGQVINAPTAVVKAALIIRRIAREPSREKGR